METKKKNIFQSKKNIFMFVSIISVVFMIGLSFAFFVASGTENVISDVLIESYMSSPIVFDSSDDLDIILNTDNFGAGATDVVNEINANVTLQNLGKESSVTKYYDIYFNISENDFEYSDQTNQTAELILSIQGPFGEITEIEGLRYITSESGVSGFDVTEILADMSLLKNVAIVAEDETVHEYTATFTIIALDISQDVNINKTFVGNFFFEESESVE